MSNYTEADVERWNAAVEKGLGHGGGFIAEEVDALCHLKAAALEGVKVPGLVADNAALHQRAMDALSVATESMTAFQRAHRANAALADLLKNPHPGAALLAEHEAQVSALQARVAELERERDAARSRAEGLAEACKELGAEKGRIASERDALRAQAEAARSRVVRSMTHEMNADVRADLLTALSAPLAETMQAPARKSRNDEGTIGPALLPGDRCAYGNTCVCGECADPDEQ